MVLKPGFERYEGLAYFGTDPYGDGVDAVVIVGQHTIEVRNTRDEVLTVWAPYSYICNQHNIPLRCYFSENEWIAPKETELSEFLDKYIAKIDQKPDIKIVNKRRRLNYFYVGLASLSVLLIGAYWLFYNAFDRLIDENISMRLDDIVAETEFEVLQACDQEAEPLLREFIKEKTQGQDYIFVRGMPSAFVRLPSGILAIDDVWAQNMQSEDTLIALLNLVRVRNLSDNPAKALVKEMPILDQIAFLRTGILTAEQVDKAWPKFATGVQIEATDILQMENPVGDFVDLAATGAIEPSEEVALPTIPSGLDFGERDWKTLITLCKAPSAGE